MPPPLLPPDRPLPAIEGAFALEVEARFDAVQGGYWQRLLDIGNGPGRDNILLTQWENTDALMLTLYQGGTSHSVLAPGAITEGETARFSAGIDGDGRMWIGKDGTLLAEAAGVVPAAVPRAGALVGRSHWAEDTPLIGAVTGLEIRLPEPAPPDPPAPDPAEPPPVVPSPDPAAPVLPAEPAPAPPGAGSGDMVIVAHQDDDLLFMNPSIAEAIDGGAPLTVVYLTAGDAGREEAYWSGRETGVKEAYAWMAGDDAPLWHDETHSLVLPDGSRADLATSHLDSRPGLRFYFLRLPDGFDGSGSDSYGGASLHRLATGEIAQATSVDGANSLTAAQLTAVLHGVMEAHRPAVLHLQAASEIEHSDHVHGADFARAALEDYGGSLWVRSYAGYDSWGREENLSPAQTAQVHEAFDRYAAHDPAVQAPGGGWLEPYVEWVKREHLDEVFHHAGSGGASPPAGPAVADPGPEGPEEPPPAETPQNPEVQDPATPGPAAPDPDAPAGQDPLAEGPPGDPPPAEGPAPGETEAPTAEAPAPEAPTPAPPPAEPTEPMPAPSGNAALIAALMAAPSGHWQDPPAESLPEEAAEDPFDA